MKIKSVITALSLLLAASASHAATTVTATGSGEWNSTVPDQPWPGGVVPQPTDNADIESPFNVLVATNASIDYIFGTGTVTMGTNATLTIVGSNAGEGTQSLGLLDTTAPGNTVVYEGNAFWCKHQNYYNLSLLGGGNLYNGEIGVLGDGDFAMTIFGSLVLAGTANVQQADSFTIMGSLVIGPGSYYDTSCSPITVYGTTLVYGILKDACGSSTALDDVFNNVTIETNGTLNLGDVIEWAINGDFINHGTVTGIGFGTITFQGTGGIIGGDSLITAPYIVFNGTNAIEDTVEVTTNTPGFNGTLNFDLAHPGEIIVPLNIGMQLYYNGTLNVTNTGAPISKTTTYKFFDAPGYNDPYSFNVINLPPYGANYSVTDTLTIDGSITIEPLTLTAGITNGTLTVSWDSTTFPNFQLQTESTTSGLAGTNWVNVGGTVSPYTATVSHTDAPSFFRLQQ